MSTTDPWFSHPFFPELSASEWFDPDLGSAAAASGLSATVNQASETSTAQAIARTKTKAVGQASETDTAQAVARAKTKAVAQSSENDSAFAITGSLVGSGISVTVGMASEDSTAQAIAAALVARPCERPVAGGYSPAIALPSRHRRAVVKVHREDEEFPPLRARRIVPVAPPAQQRAAVQSWAGEDDVQLAQARASLRARFTRPAARRAHFAAAQIEADEFPVIHARRGMPSHAVLATFLQHAG